MGSPGVSMALLLSVILCILITHISGQQRWSDPCHPQTPSPETPPTTCLRNASGEAITCEGSCGQMFNTAARRYCSCEPYCVLYKNCCPQFKTHCPKEYVEGIDFLNSHVHLKMDCTSFRFLTEDADGKRQSFMETVSLISSCLNGEHCVKTSVEDVRQPNLAVPITDTETGLDYVNFHCAKCNNVARGQWWYPRLECNAPADDGLLVVTRSRSLMPLQKRCTVHYLSPKEIGYPRTRYGCIPETAHPISSCPGECRNRNLLRQCETAVTNDYFQSGDSLYSNYFCAKCANKTQDDLVCFNHSAQVKVNLGKKHSLAILYEFDKLSGLHVGDHKCPAGEEPGKERRSCRGVVCPEDFSYLDEECVPIVYRVVTSAVIYFTKPHHLVKAFLQFKANNHTKIRLAEDVKPVLDHEVFRNDQRLAKLDAEMITPSILNVSYIYFLHNASTNYELDEMRRSVKVSLGKAVFDWLQDIKMNTSRDSIHVNDVLLGGSTYHSECSWIPFLAEAFTITNSSALHNEDHKEYTADKFRVWGTKIFVCAEPEPSEKAGHRLNSGQIFLIVLLVLCVILTLGAVYTTRSLKSALKWKRMR